jgi:serine/threonine protein kinase
MSDNLEPAGAKAGATGRVLIPDHELIRSIGTGSYGEVWLAKNALGTFRAIKIVYEHSFRHRKPFEREFNGVRKFEPISRLHDGLMDVLHVGRNDEAGYFYCVMELADDVASGQSIDPEHYEPRTLAQDLAQRKRLPIAECRQLGIAIASALEFLHDRGLIHRDVKPSNIVFVNGVPKLADIGLVAETSEAKSYVGTEGFIPPEGPGSPQSDLFSLGKVLYEISTGKDRHDYPELPELPGDPLEEKHLFELNQVVINACRADPRARFRSAREMVEALRVVGGRPPVRQRVRQAFGRAAAIAAVLALAAGIAWKTFTGNGAAGDEAPGLVGWWRGESDALDSMGRINGKLAGGNVSYAPGMIGQAFVFDGIKRSRVDLGTPASLQLQDLTIEAWIKRTNPTNISRDDNHEDETNVGGGALVLSWGHSGYGFGLMDDGRLLLSTLNVWAVYSTNVVGDTQWHHVAVTRSGTNVVFYIDGAGAGEAPYDSTFYFETPAAIGSRGDAAGGTFWGMIDELAVYDRILSPAEISTLHRFGLAGQIPPRLRPPAPLDPSLVEAWHADGDAQGVRGINKGELMNGVTFAEGRIGKAFRFDGRTQFVKIPRAPNLNLTNEVTIVFWMNAEPKDPTRAYQGLVTTDFYGVTVCNGFSFPRLGVTFHVSSDGGKSASPESFPNTADVNGGGTVIPDNEWHHIAGTYDGARLQLYLDGRPAGKPVEHTGPISPMLANGFLSIGSEDGPALPGHKGRYFKGRIDEIAIYSRALSAAEIGNLYEADVIRSNPIILSTASAGQTR